MSQSPGHLPARLARRRSSADARDEPAGRIEEPLLGLISLWLADVAAEATAEAPEAASVAPEAAPTGEPPPPEPSE